MARLFWETKAAERCHDFDIALESLKAGNINEVLSRLDKLQKLILTYREELMILESFKD